MVFIHKTPEHALHSINFMSGSILHVFRGSIHHIA